MNKEKKVLVTGGSGMVGAALKRILPTAIFTSSKECDLRCSISTNKLISEIAPDYIIHLAAHVGGVKGNTDFIADFYTNNIRINTNVLYAAKCHSVSKVISLLSTCVYPDNAEYPLTEDQVHNGEPHSSNFGYAYAKRMLDVHSRALRQQYGCNFITAVPNNLYGECDNFDLENGHVVPAVIRKIWEAKNNSYEPSFWGTGRPLREFTYAGDIAKILLFLLREYNDAEPINIGYCNETPIKDLVDIVCDQLKYNGNVKWDILKPEGQFRKPSSNQRLLDIGWEKNRYTTLEEGITLTCDWFKQNYPNIRGIV